jgi:ATP-dependent Clp protease ATP-binding subunit ClpA
LDSSDGILFLGSTTHGEYQQMLGRNGALERRLQQVPVREFNATETRELLKKSVVPMLEKKYSGRDAQGAVVPGKINDEAIDVAIRRSREYLPNSNRPEGPFKLLQDAMVRAHRKAGSQAPVLTDKDVSRFVVDRLQLPLDPGDPKNFYEGIEKVKGDLREKVVDQHRVTDAMVDLWQDVQMGMGSKDHHKVMLVAGPTGAGKTFSAQQFAKAALGSEDRFLEIDATKYSTGGLSLNSLIGAPPGVESSQNFKGILPEFLAGKGKGANVIVINEIDKAHPDLMKTLMEMLDSGKLQGGDGKTYQLGKSLIVLTTNKGDDRIYPRGTKGALSRKDIEARLDKITDRDVRGYFMEPNADDLYNTSQKLPPSVLNRIDRAVAAAPPSREGAIKVARQEVARLSGEYEQNYRYKIAFDNAALERMVDGHYVPEDGVRDLVRAVKAKVNETVKVAFNELGVGAGDTLSVSLQLGAHGEPGSFVVSKGGSSKHASIKAPAAISSFDNPLMDPEARQGLVTLEKRLGERVFGQEDAVKMSTRAIKNQLVNAQGNQPARLLYLGSTGTGKTELGKAIAKEHYGNEGKMIAFDMGNVKWEGDMNNIFGSPQGIAGSNKTSPFEQFLQDHPDGGVIIFDEIGNMGGARGSGEGNADKESMLKKFYGMLDEGRWVNAHGKRYDLSKYTLVFTSNEGQEVYNGLPSDDLRVAAWKGSKDRDSLNQILKKHGWPEALIARFNGNISLFKPLVVDERAMVAKKMVDKAVSGLTAQHGIKEITTDPDFYKEMGDAFFSHEEGARAMKIVSEGAMSDIIGDAILNNYDPERFKNSSLHLSLKDNYRGKFSFKGKVPPKREVKLSLQFKGPDGVQEYSVDLADQAVAKRLASRRSLLRTAYHEAGHAVANDPVVTGKKVDFITVRGQGGYGGYARYKNVGSVGSLSRESTIQEIGGLLAGREAEKMRGFGPDSGWTSDLEKARKLAQDAVTQYGLTDHALGLPVENGKVKVAHPKVQAEIQELLQEGEAYARDKLTRHWAQIRGVTEKLMKDGYMDGDDFEKTISLASAKASGTGVLDRHKSPPKDSCRDAFIRLLGK